MMVVMVMMMMMMMMIVLASVHFSMDDFTKMIDCLPCLRGPCYIQERLDLSTVFGFWNKSEIESGISKTYHKLNMRDLKQIIS